MSTPDLGGSSGLARPFLHPNVSRLRSYTPQSSRISSPASGSANHAQASSPSHFSLSRMSSLSNLHTASWTEENGNRSPKHPQTDVFKWTELRIIEQQLKTKSPKVSSILGAPFLGSPTALAANGLICIGTDEGKICVFDFKQKLICVCGTEATGKVAGPVTALALSFDHTYVVSGHSSGFVQLYDLKTPNSPVRTVPPTTVAAISTGRKEGHIQGSRIVNVGFVAGRHTAIVTADEHGLAFYHSLGKMLFIEASDILRILGKYQLDPLPSSNGSPLTSITHRKSRYSILSMMPLPLGTTSHPTDAYNIVALLTSTKLVIVGLKPTPKTWFKCPRVVEQGDLPRTKPSQKGSLSWFPSVLPNPSGKVEVVESNPSYHPGPPTNPRLVYSWGRTLYILQVFESKVKQTFHSSRSGKTSEVEVGAVDFENLGKWSADDDILAVQWLNVNQVLVFTAISLEVYDVHVSKPVEKVPFDGFSLVSPSLKHTVKGSMAYPDCASDVAHSIRVYKGKVFLLGRENFRVGTLLTWADKILAFVQNGDFLSAIDMSRLYYVGAAPGNKNGLPEDVDLRKEIVGQKMRDLMTASAQYAFSEDRMMDRTHNTPDGRGVDRTSLFEGLVATCCRACIALDDFDFLFEDLFQQYDDSGISRIYLLQLERFVLENEIRFVPPRITQRLVAMHNEDERPDLVERIIWHIDPACLDLNQAIHLCQQHHLYDALIYIYTRALQDYVAPVVELLSLIRRVNQYRKSSTNTWDEDTMEPIVLSAYKIYPYLANILSGLTYPSEEPLPEEESYQAKKDVYAFLFSGRSSVWPVGDGGSLILTSDEEGGVEPTYPYARLLLRFDAESFLHSLDIAFEDPYLNDKSQDVGRLVIVRILLEILSSGSLTSGDVTFVNIFIARNAPKYSQFLPIPVSTQHSILISLADDPDASTREDRQLAAEYLLSIYTPHDIDRVVQLFNDAGFYRILRIWHRQDRKWRPLLSTYIEDPELHPSELFHSIDEVLRISEGENKHIPTELVVTIADALPRLLQASIPRTADLLDKHTPDLHSRALESLGSLGDYKRFIYLQYLLGPPRPEDEEYTKIPRRPLSQSHALDDLRRAYIALQCQYHPQDVINVLKYLSPSRLDWPGVVAVCEEREVYNAAVWALNQQGHPVDALTKAETFEKRLTLRVIEALGSAETAEANSDIKKAVDGLVDLARSGISVCLDRSLSTSPDVSLEDIWLQLLGSQINCIQSVSASCSQETLSSSFTLDSRSHADRIVEVERQTLDTLRCVIQETFTSLVSISSTRALSFPRLFKRLVNSAIQMPSSKGTHYTEFRTILTGMLESYRSEGDMLIITKHLLDRDLFQGMADLTREQNRGWTPSKGMCSVCRRPLLKDPHAERDTQTRQLVIVSRTGRSYHSTCFPTTV
ncbi:Golgi CORVET complex core vacuolar protein 8-domain-containing protein [Desarmillaria tabescens]|uniref:Golgi CORVET complex core vacuolar protein 8-domain-containing protein n=1 Tax=Armillaria tabescens TaxID=1929756 RepID=A0AA39TNJ2_ARMTA|nr:Golgi CORVET complex core vacuolar protein 8-domain-containing protein [Desarmillaria tabescens]KAK0460978.1 Golgi CORVET complex core vacuolar protein 8-domain-containing protein [Desarmillaria tabescens]